MAKSLNSNLHRAAKVKNDEFYTLLPDIEKELKHYKDKFSGKIVYCNCDDPFESNFFKYFAANFNALGLKKIITTSYTKSPIVGGQLPLFEVEGLKPKGKEPFKMEIKEVPDMDGDGAINLEDVKHLLRHDKNGEVADYMAKHQHDKNANELWEYFQDVIAWVRKTFPEYRKEMASVNWGELYNQFNDKKLNAKKLEAEVGELMKDEDVTKKSGIYPYVLTRDERHLNIRSFTDNMKREAYERQKGVCSFCKEKFDISEMEADHITPWHEGGKTNAGNCQLLCKDDNRRKSGK